jgi:hypothetical protein
VDSKFQKEIRLAKIAKKDYAGFQAAVSSSSSVHRWINQGASTDELLKAIKVELENKKRYAIIKRLHQKYTKLRAQDEFDYLESIMV